MIPSNKKMRYVCVVEFEHKLAQMKDTHNLCLVFGIHVYGILYMVPFSPRWSSVCVLLLWSLCLSGAALWISGAFVRDARNFILSL